MAAPAQPPPVRKRNPSRALRLVRQRLNDQNPQQPNNRLHLARPEPREIQPADLPYDEFCPGVLADCHCAVCNGSGVRVDRVTWKQKLCKCVYRSIARRCLWEYERIQLHPTPLPRRRKRGSAWDMPRHEWAADFWMTVSRVLTDREFTVWSWMRLHRLPWFQVAAAAGLDRGNLFHELYRAEEKIGRDALWLTPHSLWPPRHYYGR